MLQRRPGRGPEATIDAAPPGRRTTGARSRSSMVRWLPGSCGTVGVVNALRASSAMLRSFRMTRRPPRSSDGSYGPCGPAWTGRPGRPPRSRDAGGPPDSGMAHRTGTVGSTVPAVHVFPPPAAHPAPGRAPGSSRTATSRPWSMASGRRSGAPEETDQPRKVIEVALAHVVGNKVEAAYARPDLSSGGGASWTIGEAYLVGERPRVSAPTGRIERLHAAQESATRHTAWTVREERRTRRVSGESVPGASRRARGYQARALAAAVRGGAQPPVRAEFDSRRPLERGSSPARRTPTPCLSAS